jgi:hypothetical protein
MLFIEHNHYFAPPFSATSLIVSNTCSGETIIPPTRLQRVTGTLHSVANLTINSQDTDTVVVICCYTSLGDFL